jgi:hypothetical protein
MKKNKIKKNTNDTTNIDQIIKYHKESSIIGNTFFLGLLLFGLIIIIFSIIYYFFKIYNPFIIGLFSFFLSSAISILYYICQTRKKCKIRMIVNPKNY